MNMTEYKRLVSLREDKEGCTLQEEASERTSNRGKDICDTGKRAKGTCKEKRRGHTSVSQGKREGNGKNDSCASQGK